MAQTKESFNENIEFLRKIIKENIWFGSKDEAYEFLDAIAKGHEDSNEEKFDELSLLKSKIEELEEENTQLHNMSNNMDPEHFTEEIFPFGSFIYRHHELNLAFEQRLEQFLQNEKK